jgi:FkbM family methyltransferase
MKSLNIIDVGARFGIHPSNLILKNIANHHLIEADENECLKLRKIYKNNSNVKIYKEFISNKKKNNYFIYSHPGGSSSLKPNPESYYWSDFRKGSSKIIKKSKVNCVSLDKLIDRYDIAPCFLKIDVEGHEVSVLKSSIKSLKKYILGARVEVELNSLYLNHEASFNEVYKLFKLVNFEFMNFDLFSNSFSPFSNYYSTSTYGQLIGCDAIFIKSPKKFFSLSEDDQIYYIIFCLNNNLQDLAINLLSKISTKKKIIERLKYRNPLIFKYIEKEIAKLFFSLRDKPRFSLEHFSKIWSKIFGKSNKWIKHGDFYSRFPL